MRFSVKQQQQKTPAHDLQSLQIQTRFHFILQDATVRDLLTPSPNAAAALLPQTTNNADLGVKG